MATARQIAMMTAPCFDTPAVPMLSWVHSVQQGDEEAAQSMWRHLQPLVLKLVRAYLPWRSSEEDMVQTVFMKVFTKLDQFSGRVPLEHWVSRIAVNTCLNQIDTERVRPELRWADLSEAEEQMLEAHTAATDDPEPSRSLADKELVAKLLAQLSLKDRRVVSMLYLEGKSLAEIRQLTGWSISMIKVRAYRARAKMKKHLTNLLAERE